MIKAIITLSIILTIMFMAFTFIFCPVLNEIELKYCQLYNNEEVIYETHFFLDKCYIIEDGEELTIAEYKTKHKYDGMRIRK